jgi:hypothetical protein
MPPIATTILPHPKSLNNITLLNFLKETSAPTVIKFLCTDIRHVRYTPRSQLSVLSTFGSFDLRVLLDIPQRHHTHPVSCLTVTLTCWSILSIPPILVNTCVAQTLYLRFHSPSSFSFVVFDYSCLTLSSPHTVASLQQWQRRLWRPLT